MALLMFHDFLQAMRITFTTISEILESTTFYSIRPEVGRDNSGTTMRAILGDMIRVRTDT